MAAYFRQEASTLAKSRINSQFGSALDRQDELGRCISIIQQTKDRPLLALIARVDLGANEVCIKISSARLRDLLMPKNKAAQSPGTPNEDISLTAPLKFKRRGVERKIVIGEILPEPDPILINLLKNAHRYLSHLKAGASLTEIASAEGKSNTLIRTRIPLALLSPKIQKAIVEGIQPLELTADRIIKSPIPSSWSDQERLYGFA